VVSDARFQYEPLGKAHRRAAFHCGVEELDRYLREQAGQDQRRHLSSVYILNDTEKQIVAGHSTLSATSIRFVDVPEPFRRRLPRYAELPATLIGRLAADQGYQGQGFGRPLLPDALHRALRSSGEVAAMAVVVDPIDDAARQFSVRHDFRPHEGGETRLFLPMDTAAKLPPPNR
jgi:GNAT superfamily N-acetyltransferase